MVDESKLDMQYKKLEYGGLLSIPKFLRLRRKNMGFTQEALSKKSHVGKRVIEFAESRKGFAEGRGLQLLSFLRILRALRVKIRFVDADSGRDLHGRFKGKTAKQVEAELDKEQ